MANIDLQTGYAKWLNKKYKINVVIKDSTYKKPVSMIKEFAKGKARKISNSTVKGNKLGLFKLAKILEKKYLFLTKPVKNITSFTKNFWQAVFTSNNIQRINNTYKALIIQAINKGKYGSNKKATIKRKGFDRKLIDTGQTIRAIRVEIKGLTRK